MVTLALSILSAFVAEEEERRLYTPSAPSESDYANSPQGGPGKDQHNASTLTDSRLMYDSDQTAKLNILQNISLQIK